MDRFCPVPAPVSTEIELSLDNRDVSVLKYLPMNTNRFFTAYNFYFWFGYFFRPSARVSV